MPNGSSHLDDARNRRVQRKAGRRHARKVSAGAHESVIGSFKHLSERLFVVRESDEYDYELLAKMLQQTLHPFLDAASVRTALEVGVEPMRTGRTGSATRTRLQARQIYSNDGLRRRIGVLFRIDRDWFLYLLTSAGKRAVDGHNEATRIICETLDEVRPALLITGPMSRIVRTVGNGAIVAEHLQRNRTAVQAQGVATPMDLNDPAGRAVWDMLLRLAEADYHATLRRLLTGLVFELRHGRYPRSAKVLPYGYRMKTVDGRPTREVEVDHSQKPIVQSIIELAASDLSLRAAADELYQRHGLESRRPGQESAVPVNQVSHPDTLVKLLFEALPLYLDGKYRFSHEVSIPHLDDLYGIPVERVSPEDNGHIVVDLDFGLPEGGWHDPEVIERGIVRRLSHDSLPTVRSDREEIRPLASYVQWFDEDHEYRLLTEDDRYCLRRRPSSESTTELGRQRGFHSYDGELIGSFPDVEFHRIVAEALEQVASGVSTDVPCAEVDDSDLGFDDLEQQRRTARDAADAARTEATLASSEEARGHYRELGEQHQADADRLAEQLGQVHRIEHVEDLRLDAAQIAACVVGLRSAKPFGSIALHQALRRLLRNVRIDARPRDPLASISFGVEARTNQGSLVLGPIETVLPNHAVGCGPKDPGWRQGFAERRLGLLRYVVLEEAAPEERRTLMRSFPIKKRKWDALMIEALHPFLPNRQAASAILDCPVLSLRRAVIGPLLGLDLEHDLNEELANEARRLFGDPHFEWSKSWCPGGMDRRRTVLHFIDRYDEGDGITFATIRDHLMIAEPTVYALLGARADGTKYSVSTVGSHPCLEDVDGWYASGSRKRGLERRVRVRQCPHCHERKLIQPLKVPEVPGQLLCTACLRDPVSGLRFTDSYLLPWEGPQSLARRQGRSPLFNRHEGLFIDDELRGTHPYAPIVPSLHSPRRRR